MKIDTNVFITTTIIFFFLSLLCGFIQCENTISMYDVEMVDELTQHKLSFNSYTTLNTVTPCINTVDCFKALNRNRTSWCASGLVCILNQCHIIRNYPCHSQTQRCDETQKACRPNSCRNSSECDDHIFCNGREECSVDNTCIISSLRNGDNYDQCLIKGSICDESARQCTLPTIISQWRIHMFSLITYSKIAGLYIKGGVSNIILPKIDKEESGGGDDIIGKQDNDIFSVSTLSNSTTINENDWLLWVLFASGTLIFLAVVFMLISYTGAAARTYPPRRY